ncbi:TetR/AcrR family transcriptional regulator [Flavobacteriaceae bacterium F08102]|nr:TetR/AcrR family transcriptional regulator [Flavobacteriaceae bacterium F08102]
MARSKQYKEEDVIEKAMALFWRNGYESTSVRMLEKAMGINQFSIYASFGSKQGVFVESLKFYRKRIKKLTDTLAQSQNGIVGIKAYFYNFIEFSKDYDMPKGCLITNTISEIGGQGEREIIEEIKNFSKFIRTLFEQNLKQEGNKDAATIERQSNYLLTAMLGLSSGSKLLKEHQLADFIETAFLNL